MGDPTDDPTPPDLPDDLVDGVRELDDYRLRELARYAEWLLDERTRPIVEEIRETEGPDRIVRVEDEGGYATVVRRDSGDGPPVLYRVTREHYPDGSVDLHWHFLGAVND